MCLEVVHPDSWSALRLMPPCESSWNRSLVGVTLSDVMCFGSNRHECFWP
jgi:hypothetical protein